MSSDRLGESSASIGVQVQAPRERQRVRFEGADMVCYSDMRVAKLAHTIADLAESLFLRLTEVEGLP